MQCSGPPQQGLRTKRCLPTVTDSMSSTAIQVVLPPCREVFA